MFKKTIAFAAAAVLALSMIATGCGKVEESSITMDMSDEKVATIEFSNAKDLFTSNISFYNFDDWRGRIIKVKPDSDEVEYLSWFS